MESQPQNPEFRNNPENFTNHECTLPLTKILKVNIPGDLFPSEI